MDIEKHLILIKGEDKTEEISRCEYQDGKWFIEYRKGKLYQYSSHNVAWFKNPQLIDVGTTIVYHNDNLLTGINKIIKFIEYIRICFVTGYKKHIKRMN